MRSGPGWDLPVIFERRSCGGARPAGSDRAARRIPRRVSDCARRASELCAHASVGEKRYPGGAHAVRDTLLSAQGRRRGDLRRSASRDAGEGLRDRRGEPRRSCSKSGSATRTACASRSRSSPRSRRTGRARSAGTTRIKRGERAMPGTHAHRECARRSRASSTRRASICSSERRRKASACSCRSPRLSCCATRNCTRTRSTCSARRSKRIRSSPDLMYDYALTAEKLNRIDLLETNLRELIQIKPDHAHAVQRAWLLARRSQRAAAGGEKADRESARARARGLLHHGLAWAGCSTAWAT